VRLDPTFTQALARVSLSYALALWWGWEIDGQPPDSLLARGMTATGMILARDSGVADAWTAYALMLTFRHPRSYDGAEAAFQRALALDSVNAETWQQYAWLLQTTGRDDDGAAAYRRALAIDPDRPVTWSALAWLYYYLLRRYPEALAATDSGLALDTTAYWLYFSRTRSLIAVGDTAGALRSAQAALRYSPPDYTIYGDGAMALAEAAAGRPGAVLQTCPQAYVVHGQRGEVR